MGMFASVLINRSLGPELKGVFVSCLLIPQTAVVFSELGLGTAGAYQLAKNRYRPGSIILFLLLASLILGVIAMAVTGAAFRLPGDAWGGLNRFLILSIIPPGLWLTFLPEIFLGLGLLRGYNGWRTGFQAFRLLLIAFLLFLSSNKLQAVILATIILNWAAFIVSAAALCLYIKPHFKDISKEQISGFFRFGIKVFAGEVLGFLHYRTDIFLLLLWKGNAQVGIYATAAFLSELLWMISRGLYAPAFAALAKDGLSRGTVKRAALTAFAATLGLAALSAVLVSPAVKLLYGLSFSAAVWPFILLLPGTVLLSIPKFLEAPLIAEMGKPEVLIWCKGVGLLLNIGLNLWLIPRYGTSGAAVASSVSYSMQAGIFIWLFSRISRRSVPGNTEGYALISEHESDMNEIAD